MRLRDDSPKKFREIQVGEIFLQMYLISVSTCPDFGVPSCCFLILKPSKTTRDPFLTALFRKHKEHIYVYVYIYIYRQYTDCILLTLKSKSPYIRLQDWSEPPWFHFPVNPVLTCLLSDVSQAAEIWAEVLWRPACLHHHCNKRR